MKPTLPAEVPVRETLEFVLEVVPTRARVLEVGCGAGALAAELKALGREVMAIDRDPEKVKQARERGVEAVETEFLDFRDGRYDVVLFTRSLHHLDPLEGSIEHARALLQPAGLVVADEFAIEAMDRDTARWFFELRGVLEAAGLMPPDPDPPSSPHPLERWFEAHAVVRPLHPGSDMLRALGDRLDLVTRRRGPYLYRTFCDRMEGAEPGLRVAQWILDRERARIGEHSLAALGLRMIARK